MQFWNFYKARDCKSVETIKAPHWLKQYLLFSIFFVHLLRTDCISGGLYSGGLYSGANRQKFS
jgi:hypothetical protein